VSLLARVSEALRAAGLPHALIGASAMTLHGVNARLSTWISSSSIRPLRRRPRDAWDIQQILAGPERDALIAGVDRELQDLPQECSRLWQRILDAAT
jgi:hypothetical protein